MPKVKVPKRVAGVKVPKKLRKEAKRALNLADSPAVRDLALAGLTLAAENLLDRSKARQNATAARDAVRVARDATKASLKALDLGDILRAAAVEGARRFLEGFEEAQRSSAAATASARSGKTATKAAKRPARKPAAKRPAAKPAKVAKAPARKVAKAPARKPAAKTLSAKRPAASKTKAPLRPRRRKASGNAGAGSAGGARAR